MKSSNIKIFLILVTNILSMSAQPYMGEWVHETQENGRTDYTPIRFYSEVKPYVKGGVSFSFPAGYFTSAPHVYVSIQLNKLKYVSSLELNSFINEISPLLTKVYVNKTSTGLITNSIAQADTDDVNVYILAYGF